MASAPPLPPRFCVALVSAAALAFALAACDAGAPTPAGGVSKGEAEALAEAAEMLDETRQLPDAAVPELTASEPKPASPEMTGDSAR